MTVEPFFEWAIERPPFGDDPPRIPGAHFVDDLAPYIERKLFTVNTGHATTAYFGAVAGVEKISDALADAAIAAKVSAALEETSALLVAKHGLDPADLASYRATILRRFRNPALPDTVWRVGRQPLRKLSRHERFVGPAAEAAERGLSVDALVDAMGAALAFDDAEDEQAVDLQRMLRDERCRDLHGGGHRPRARASALSAGAGGRRRPAGGARVAHSLERGFGFTPGPDQPRGVHGVSGHLSAASPAGDRARGAGSTCRTPRDGSATSLIDRLSLVSSPISGVLPPGRASPVSPSRCPSTVPCAAGPGARRLPFSGAMQTPMELAARILPATFLSRRASPITDSRGIRSPAGRGRLPLAAAERTLCPRRPPRRPRPSRASRRTPRLRVAPGEPGSLRPHRAPVARPVRARHDPTPGTSCASGRHWRRSGVIPDALAADLIEALAQACRCQEPRDAVATARQCVAPRTRRPGRHRLRSSPGCPERYRALRTCSTREASPARRR